MQLCSHISGLFRIMLFFFVSAAKDYARNGPVSEPRSVHFSGSTLSEDGVNCGGEGYLYTIHVQLF